MVAGTAEGLRTFGVSRIESARLLDKGCARPSGFDLAAWWASSTEELARTRGRFAVTLRVEPRTAAAFQWWHRRPLPPPGRRRGFVTIDAHFDDEEEAAFVVLGLGAKVDVVRPASLRERVAREHAAALERAGD